MLNKPQSSEGGEKRPPKVGKGKIKKGAKKPPPKKLVKSYLFDKVDAASVPKPLRQKTEITALEHAKQSVFSGLEFETLRIHPHQVKNLKEVLLFKELTKVQERAIPVALDGKDLLIRSQTGSGKTLCYALPIIEKLQEMQPRITRSDGVFALVVVPTRELALQSYELLLKLVKPFQWIVPGYLSGGEKRKSEKARLRNGINVLIGTPGRLCDHLIHTDALKLRKVEYLVLDEADRLFELGYEKDVRSIVEVLQKHKGLAADAPEEGVKSETLKELDEDRDAKNESKDTDEDDRGEEGREEEKKSHKTQRSKQVKPMEVTGPVKATQTILLSATLTAKVKELAGLTLVDPTFVDCRDAGVVEKDFNTINDSEEIDDAVIPSTVTQSYVVIPPKLRLVSLSGLIANEIGRHNNKILVFLATQDLVDYHYDIMVDVLARQKSTHESDSEE